jgi:hypothetical protein
MLKLPLRHVESGFCPPHPSAATTKGIAMTGDVSGAAEAREWIVICLVKPSEPVQICFLKVMTLKQKIFLLLLKNGISK